MTKQEFLLDRLRREINDYVIACNIEALDDLCYPIDFANRPLLTLEELGYDVEKLSEYTTLNHFSDRDIADYLDNKVYPLLIIQNKF